MNNEQLAMNKRTLTLALILCLGIGLMATTVWAQTGGFRLTGSAFSQAGTGAAPLTSDSFQVRASVGQPSPLGSADSDSFSLTAGYQPPVGAGQYRVYLPLVVRDLGS
jgi:hypothetical protein